MSDLTKNTILSKLKELKPKYAKDGLIFLGIFGSFAKDSATKDSDIDILYDLEPKKFLSLYPGFKAFNRLSEIKDELRAIFQRDIDLADNSSLNDIGKKYILRDTVYV